MVAPEQDEILESKTLQDLRDDARAVAHHRAVAQEVSRHPEPIHAVIMRARRADGSGQFRIAKTLDDQELEEAGYLLVRAQLDAWRPLLREALLAVARVELRVWELAALRSGALRVRRELESKMLSDDADVARAAREDAALLRQGLLNFGVGLDTALGELLPQRLADIESQRAQAGEVAANSG